MHYSQKALTTFKVSGAAGAMRERRRDVYGKVVGCARDTSAQSLSLRVLPNAPRTFNH